MVIIYFSLYEWTDCLTDVLNKIIINNILTPFIVSLNAYITNVLIKQVLIDSPLLIIKENINCGNFLNKDRFNFLTKRVNYEALTDFPIIIIDERVYGEALFHIFSQDEIYSNAYMDRIMADFEIFLNSTHFNRLLHDYSNTTTTQQEHKGAQEKVCFLYIL